MKIQLTEMITHPQPVASPLQALYVALLATACLVAATAALWARI